MRKAMRKAKRRKTARIYYGSGKSRLYWTVRVKDAIHPVIISGSFMDALRGTPGETIGCHLSNCALRNSKAFPHPVKLASFTRTTAFVVDKIAKGQPSHAIRYRHSYSEWVDRNDVDRGKTFLKKHPEMADREFTLRAPASRGRLTRAGTGVRGTDKDTGVYKSRVPRGALSRAKKAGLITADLERAVN